MQERLTIKTIFKIDSLTTRYRLPAFTADDHLFARTLDGTIAPQLIAAADTPSRSSDGQLRVFSMSLQDREIAVIIIVCIGRSRDGRSSQDVLFSGTRGLVPSGIGK